MSNDLGTVLLPHLLKNVKLRNQFGSKT